MSLAYFFFFFSTGNHTQDLMHASLILCHQALVYTSKTTDTLQPRPECLLGLAHFFSYIHSVYLPTLPTLPTLLGTNMTAKHFFNAFYRVFSSGVANVKVTCSICVR